jgi:predicted peroxiredoxin
MSECLSIAVVTDKNLEHLLGIARAAKIQGKTVEIFFTGRGVLLTGQAGFDQLAELANMSLCKVSLMENGLDPQKPLPGIPLRRFLNQAQHGLIIDKADRYLVL